MFNIYTLKVVDVDVDVVGVGGGGDGIGCNGNGVVDGHRTSRDSGRSFPGEQVLKKKVRETARTVNPNGCNLRLCSGRKYRQQTVYQRGG